MKNELKGNTYLEVTEMKNEIEIKEEKSVVTEERMRKFKLKAIKAVLSVATVAMLAVNACVMAFAVNNENSRTDVKTSTMTTLIGIVFWVVRAIILIVGVVPGLIKVTQGQADENPRDRNNGLATIVIAGAAFAATFPLADVIV